MSDHGFDDERHLDYLRACEDAERERLERDLDERDKALPLPLPQLSPLASMNERHGMSARDPDLPEAA